MWCNISYTALSSATPATGQSEGSNAFLRYFMKVAGGRGDVQTGLIAAADFGDNAQMTGETQQQSHNEGPQSANFSHL